jgi:hypothetical protein
MNIYRFDEIENKHGQNIADFSREKGNTELEKFRNFIKGGSGIEFTIT